MGSGTLLNKVSKVSSALQRPRDTKALVIPTYLL